MVSVGNRQLAEDLVAEAQGGGQHEIRVPPGQARAVAPEAEAAAAGGVAGVGAGEGFLRAAGPWQWFGAGGRASAHGPPRQCPHMRGGKKRWPFGQCWPRGATPWNPPAAHGRTPDLLARPVLRHAALAVRHDVGLMFR